MCIWTSQYRTSIQHHNLKSECVNHAFSCLCTQRLQMQCVLKLCNAFKSRGCLVWEPFWCIFWCNIDDLASRSSSSTGGNLSHQLFSCVSLILIHFRKKRYASSQDIGACECGLIFNEFLFHPYLWGNTQRQYHVKVPWYHMVILNYISMLLHRLLFAHKYFVMEIILGIKIDRCKCFANKCKHSWVNAILLENMFQGRIQSF